jgi:hypothetical protein
MYFNKTYIYIHICTHTHTYIYIYIYIYNGVLKCNSHHIIKIGRHTLNGHQNMVEA